MNSIATPVPQENEPILETDIEVFRENLNLRSFMFSHTLADHPLFEIPRLARLARSLSGNPKHYAYMAGDLVVDKGWKQAQPPPLSLEECILQIHSANSWAILKHTELDPEYQRLMEQFKHEFTELSGWDLAIETKDWEAQIMITSPGRVTPYHIDNECNFLLQIGGEKVINIFDQTDREVLSDEELEYFWAANENAAQYKPQYQERAYVYRLAPGKVVHLPVNAPHWLKNGENVSISLSINCELVNLPQGRVFEANYYLRQLGVKPTPPGRSALRDRLKSCLVRTARTLKHAFHGRS